MTSVDETLGDLLSLVGAEPSVLEEQEPHERWRQYARYAVGVAVAERAAWADEAGPVPNEWFEPLLRATVQDPDPDLVKHLVRPAITAFGLRRVRLALLDYLETGVAADAAGAARAWYWTLLPLTLRLPSGEPTPESVAERAKYRDLDLRYTELALHRFVADDDLDVRRYLLPSLPLRPETYPEHMRTLIAQVVEIVRTTDDEFMRHWADEV
jgi:hypothetical protein